MKFFLILFVLFGTLNTPTEASAHTQVEEAISMQLAITNNLLPDEALLLQKEMTLKITQAAYGNALDIAMKGLNKFPQNFLLQTYFAMIIGDYAQQFSRPLKGKMLNKSQLIFKKLMSEIGDQPQGIVFYFKNEYYFRFAEYKHQYENGLARVASYWGTKDWSTKGFGYYPQGIGGYYSQGVGASNYARELFKNGDKRLAQVYAQKALIAWAQCFSYDNNYYNAYVHYALALGILGNKQEMLRALQHGADLIHQDLNYPEFKRVIENVNSFK